MAERPKDGCSLSGRLTHQRNIHVSVKAPDSQIRAAQYKKNNFITKQTANRARFSEGVALEAPEPGRQVDTAIDETGLEDIIINNILS